MSVQVQPLGLRAGGLLPFWGVYSMDLRENYQARHPWMPVGRTRSLVGSGHPGLMALLGAEFWVDASQSQVAGGLLKNLGTGGAALDARFGSTTGTDANDPTLLTHSGTNYLYLPGVAATNYASTPDSAAVSVTGDIEIVLRVAADDWTPATAQSLVAKRTIVDGLSFQLVLITSGQITWGFNNGVDLFGDGILTPPVALTDGQAYWLRFRRVAATGVISMDQAPDQATEPTTWPTAWTPTGTRSTGNITDTNAIVEIGSNRTGVNEQFGGKFYRAIVRNGIGGTTVLDADFTRGITSGGQTSFTEFSANAATVTINRATSGRKAVAVVRNVLLLGTDDYLEVADNALLNMGAAQSFTLLAITRTWNTATLSRLISKRPNVAAGGRWGLEHAVTTPTPGFIANDGTTGVNPTSGNMTVGTLHALTAVVDRTGQTATVYTGNTPGTGLSVAAVGSLSNALPMRIGSVSDAVTGADDEVVAAAVFRRALSAAEIATIVAYYGAS